jgi:SAM-dependent methyltransferase
VTPQDLVIDLGSGDGRTVIAAATRGATAIGVEYNPDMVDLAQGKAKAAGVSAKATIVRADLFEYDFSKAQVVTMFLLPTINLRLRPQVLEMKPGTRIVSNTFTMDDWQADQTETIPNCTSWCTALLWIVPARVDGAWQVGGDTLTIDQQYQRFTGRLGNTVITEGALNGAEISFMAGNRTYTGRVDGNGISGTISGGGTWKATKR